MSEQPVDERHGHPDLADGTEVDDTAEAPDAGVVHQVSTAVPEALVPEEAQAQAERSLAPSIAEQDPPRPQSEVPETVTQEVPNRGQAL